MRRIRSLYGLSIFGYRKMRTFLWFGATGMISFLLFPFIFF